MYANLAIASLEIGNSKNNVKFITIQCSCHCQITIWYDAQDNHVVGAGVADRPDAFLFIGMINSHLHCLTYLLPPCNCSYIIEILQILYINFCSIIWTV